MSRPSKNLAQNILVALGAAQPIDWLLDGGGKWEDNPALRAGFVGRDEPRRRFYAQCLIEPWTRTVHYRSLTPFDLMADWIRGRQSVNNCLLRGAAHRVKP